MSTLIRLHHRIQQGLNRWAQHMAHAADRRWEGQADPLSRYY